MADPRYGLDPNEFRLYPEGDLAFGQRALTETNRGPTAVFLGAALPTMTPVDDRGAALPQSTPLLRGPSPVIVERAGPPAPVGLLEMLAARQSAQERMAVPGISAGEYAAREKQLAQLPQLAEVLRAAETVPAAQPSTAAQAAQAAPRAAQMLYGEGFQPVSGGSPVTVRMAQVRPVTMEAALKANMGRDNRQPAAAATAERPMTLREAMIRAELGQKLAAARKPPESYRERVGSRLERLYEAPVVAAQRAYNDALQSGNPAKINQTKTALQGAVTTYEKNLAALIVQNVLGASLAAQLDQGR